jgi:uncharacterized protein
MTKAILTTIAALAIAACGGAVFFLIHAPLPWTLGSLSATGLVAVAGRPWLLRTQARTIVRPVIGVLAGSAFTAELLVSMLHWWSAILIVFVYALTSLLIGYVYFRKVGRFDGATAFFASAPGGLGELSLIGGSLGADMRRLVVVHSIRILMVVFSVPFALQIILGQPIGRTVPTLNGAATLSGIDWIVLAACAFGGFLISRAVRIPAGPMLFPMFLSMAVHVGGLTHAAPPSWLIASVQVVLGGVIGARFAGLKWHHARHAIITGIVWAAAMIGMAAAFAVIGAWILGYPYFGMLLALAPGGMVEMTVITYAVGIDVAFVVVCQLFRILLVLVMTPFAFQLLGIPTGGTSGSTSNDNG